MENQTPIPIATGYSLCSVSIYPALESFFSWLLILSVLPLVISIFIYAKYSKNLFFKIISIIFLLFFILSILGLAYSKIIPWLSQLNRLYD
jgi:hypothetical protein